VTWCDVERPAVVLGSTQADAVVDAGRATAAGIDVVRRRSGGGAVLLVAGEVVWADVVVPAGDPLWHDDVGRAFAWLGRAWADALSSLGVDSVTVHEGPPIVTTWSRLVCFAGRGAGEVAVGPRKVVGISQRRTRSSALFQCACLLRWDPAPLAHVLAFERDDERDELAQALTALAVGLDELVGPVPPAAVEAAFLAALTSR